MFNFSYVRNRRKSTSRRFPFSRLFGSPQRPGFVYILSVLFNSSFWWRAMPETRQANQYYYGVTSTVFELIICILISPTQPSNLRFSYTIWFCCDPSFQSTWINPDVYYSSSVVNSPYSSRTILLKLNISHSHTLQLLSTKPDFPVMSTFYLHVFVPNWYLVAFRCSGLQRWTTFTRRLSPAI